MDTRGRSAPVQRWCPSRLASCTVTPRCPWQHLRHLLDAPPNRRPNWSGPAIPKAARRTSRPTRPHPDRVVGFEVEIADLIARGLGRTPRFVNITFTSIDQSIARGDADIGLSGIEDTPASARRSRRRFRTTSFARF